MRDASEFVAPLIDRLPVRRRLGPVTVQDPCHLRHVQRAHLPVRTVLAAVADVVELDDEGLCCGAGGAYSALQPELAGEIRERKLAAIERAGPQVVASANPGLRVSPRCRRRQRQAPDGPRRRGVVSGGRYDDLADRLQVVVDDLDQITFDQLREASAEGQGRPADDKRLTQARRAVEKAIHLLRGRRAQASTNELTVSISSRKHAVAVLGEREGDACQVELVVLLAFRLERRGPDDPARCAQVAEPLVELGELVVGRACFMRITTRCPT